MLVKGVVEQPVLKGADLLYHFLELFVPDLHVLDRVEQGHVVGEPLLHLADGLEHGHSVVKRAQIGRDKKSNT